AQEVGTTAITATRVRSVAERAVHAPLRLPPFDRGRVARLARRIRDESAAPSPALRSRARTVASGRRSPLLSGGRDDARGDERRGEHGPCGREVCARNGVSPGGALTPPRPAD